MTHEDVTAPAQPEPIRCDREEEAARKFDLVQLAESAWSLQLLWSQWRLLEQADAQVDFYRHAGHDPEDIRFQFYAEIVEAIARMLPVAIR